MALRVTSPSVTRARRHIAPKALSKASKSRSGGASLAARSIQASTRARWLLPSNTEVPVEDACWSECNIIWMIRCRTTRSAAARPMAGLEHLAQHERGGEVRGADRIPGHREVGVDLGGREDEHQRRYLRPLASRKCQQAPPRTHAPSRTSTVQSMGR